MKAVFEVVNPQDVWHDGTGYVHLLRYRHGAYAVYTCRNDAGEAMDIFADYSRDALPGFTPDDGYIDELIADAVRDGHGDNPEAYVDDFFMRAGNDGGWIDMPEAIDTVPVRDCIIATTATMEV